MPSTLPFTFCNMLCDLALARTQCEQADAELAAVLAKLGLEWVD